MLDSSKTQRTTSEPSPLPFTITPADTDLAQTARALHPNTDGWIRVTGVADTDGNYAELYVLRGVDVPVHVKRVWATVSGSPAVTSIVGYR